MATIRTCLAATLGVFLAAPSAQALVGYVAEPKAKGLAVWRDTESWKACSEEQKANILAAILGHAKLRLPVRLGKTLPVEFGDRPVGRRTPPVEKPRSGDDGDAGADPCDQRTAGVQALQPRNRGGVLPQKLVHVHPGRGAGAAVDAVADAVLVAVAGASVPVDGASLRRVVAVVDPIEHAVASDNETAENGGIRLIATDPTEGEEPGFYLSVVSQPAEDDEVIEEEGARVFLDQQAAIILDGKVLDSVIEDGRATFAIADQADHGRAPSGV